MPTYLLVNGERPVRVATPTAVLQARLGVPEHARGLVVIANGAADSCFAEGNQHVAAVLRGAGFATLVVCLLTSADAATDTETSELRFHLPLLSERLRGAAAWAALHPALRGLKVGYFAAGVSAAAALEAAAEAPNLADAIVSRSGRPELAGASLRDVRAPTLLLVSERDVATTATNQRAIERLPATARLHLVPGASPRLDDATAVETVAQLACAWFERMLHDATVSEPIQLRVAARR